MSDPQNLPPNGLSYKQAGVDIDAGNALVEAIKPAVRSTRRPGADGEIGGFGGLFDLKADAIKGWKLPTPWSAPYDVVTTRQGEAWTGSMLNDRVSRLNTATGEVVDYLLPRTTNIRRVFVDETGVRPVLWVGSNHGASIVKVEPLD